MAMGNNLWLQFGLDELPFATYFDVHQAGFLTHSHMKPPENCRFWSMFTSRALAPFWTPVFDQPFVGHQELVRISKAKIVIPSLP